MAMRRAATILVALLALAALSGVGTYQAIAPQAERTVRWREIAWPFPRDGWPAGRAFRGEGGGCDGAEFYVRPKRGFCNCDRGVADDDEVDRVTDLDLMSTRFAATAPGNAFRVGEMLGRDRNYDLEMLDGARRAATGIALSRNCDLVVAVVQGRGEAAVMQRAALELMDAQKMKNWMMAALDGR